MIKYRTEEWSRRPEPKIIKVECERETDMCIWENGRKHLKRSAYYNYFDTWKEAYDHILKLAKDRVVSARLQLDSAKGLLGNIKGLKEGLCGH